MERMAVAHVLLCIAVAMISGFISMGWLAERLSRSGIGVLTTAVMGMALFMLVQVMVLVAPVGWALQLWVLFGFFGTSGIISYAALSQRFPVQLSGRALSHRREQKYGAGA